MAELILVRHGQANSHATDEASYDVGLNLFAVQGELDFIGHCARSMGYTITRQDPRLDELHYFDIAHAMQAQHGIPIPDSPSAYAGHLPQLLDHWERGTITGVPERFETFSARVRDMLDALCAMDGRILVVTSGGVIGMIMRHALGLHNGSTAKIMLQIMNSSMHRLEYVHDQLMVGTFNATPHLDAPDRAHARTHV